MKLLLKKKKINILRDYNLIPQEKNLETMDSINSFINHEKSFLGYKAHVIEETRMSKKNLKDNNSSIKKEYEKKSYKSSSKEQNTLINKDAIYNEIDIIDIIDSKENEKSNSEEENMFENIFQSINKGKINKSGVNESASYEVESKRKISYDGEKKKNEPFNEAQNIIRNVLNNQLNNNYLHNLTNTKEDNVDDNKLTNFSKIKDEVKVEENKKKNEEVNQFSDNMLKNSILDDINNISESKINHLRKEGKIEKIDSIQKNRNDPILKENPSKTLVEKQEYPMNKDAEMLFSTNNLTHNSQCELNNTKIDRSFNKKDEKFNQILSYLDDRKNVFPSSHDNSNLNNKSTISKQNNQLPTSNPETLNLMVELKESKKTIETMKIILEELRNELKLKENHFKNELEEKINTIKYELERKISEKNQEINSLESVNTKLDQHNKRIEEELSNSEKNYNKKLSSLMENFEIERKKDKEAWFTAEKVRKKKWEDQKIKEIKENTIKGLEPEIEKILQSHKAELFEMEEKFAQELKKQKEKVTNYYEEKIGDYRDKFIREKEEALENEKAIFAQRIRNQCDRMENEHNEERRRWTSNLNAEISRIEVLREKDKKQYEEEFRKNEERFKKITEERDVYYKGKISELENRFNEKNKQEIDDWRMKFEKEKEKFLEEKQKEYEIKFNNIKHEMMKDKEKQLEMVIVKLGEETISERRKIQIECEQKADSINKTLKVENEQLKQKMNELTEKLSAESKVRIMLDDNLEILSKKIVDMEKDMFYKDKKIHELTSSMNDLQNKLNNVHIDHAKQKNSLENDLLMKLEKSNNEIRVLSEKSESLKNYYETKLSEQKNNYDYQISIIDTKIKKKLESREEIIAQLQDDLHLKEIAIQKYEELLAKQRKELLLNN
jgi:5-azacytidine-induced protein 1